MLLVCSWVCRGFFFCGTLILLVIVFTINLIKALKMTLKTLLVWRNENNLHFFFFFLEEIFDSPEAIWSSNDGTHIVYASFNDTNVSMMTYPWFATGSVLATSGLGSGSSFPETRSVRYPTPGSVNPEVHLWVIDITNVTEILRWHVTPPVALDGQ